MEAFEYSALPARVIFGFGTLARVTDELIALGRKRAFVLSDPHHAPAGATRLWNPRPIERDPIRALLDDAYHGRRPS
jgi:hypothetical protein